MSRELVSAMGSNIMTSFHWNRKIAGGMAMIGLALFVALNSGCEARPEPRYGNVSEDWRLRELTSGRQVSLESLRGKVLFINIWATWCGPCRQELPSIVQLYERFKDNPNVAFLLVSVDDTLSDVEEFVDREKLSVPIYTGLSAIPRAFVTEGIPATFILDGEGNIHKRDIGSRDWNNPNTAGLIQRLAQSTKS